MLIRNLFSMVAGLVLMALAMMPMPVLANDGAVLIIPWGDWAADALYVVGTIAIALIAKRIHGWLDAKIGKEQTDRVEQLLSKAITYGINTTSGALAGKQMTAEIGNKVLASAASYALQQAPKLVTWAGGRDAITAKILARLDLDEKAGT